MWNKLFYLLYVAGYPKHGASFAYDLTPRKFLLIKVGSKEYNECTATIKNLIDALTDGLSRGEFPCEYSSDVDVGNQLKLLVNNFLDKH